jgi:hypothetical protein
MARVAPSMIVDRDFLRWFAKMQRHFVPPDAAAELMQTGGDRHPARAADVAHADAARAPVARHERDRDVAAGRRRTIVLLDGRKSRDVRG